MHDGERKIPIHFGSKGEGHNGTMSTLWFWHNDLSSFQRTSFIHRCRMAKGRYLYILGTKVKVTTELCQLFSEPGRIFEELMSALPSVLACDAPTKTLTLAVTLLLQEIRLSCCTCVFLVTRPFTWYHKFWPCDLYLEVLLTFEKLKPWPTFEKL